MQAMLSIVGRLLLCGIFIMSAVANKIPNYAEVVKGMEAVGVPAPNILLAGAIAFLLIGGITVILGFKAKFGALLLAIFLVAVTYYFHNPALLPADATDQLKQETLGALLKNAALLGAMLFIVANGSGAGSLDAGKPATAE